MKLEGEKMVTTTRYLSTREAATYTRLGKSTLERMRIEGNGPTFIKATASRIVYSIEDLDAYLAARRYQSTAAVERSGTA